MDSQNLTFNRLFSTGPTIVVAVDHGMFDGPIPGLNTVPEIPDRILPDIDGVLMSPGMLRDIGGRLCGGRNSPVAIVRINWSTVYCFGWDYHSGDTVRAYKPADVLRWGAQIVLISLSLRTGSEKKDAQNIEVFCDLCRQAHELGMPVVGEYFPVNDEALSEDELFDEIKTCCRILYELGADIIKTFYTKNFQEVVAGCPIPILSLGGKRLASDLAALEYAQAQIESGAAGIVFGRNVIQSKRPLKMQKALLEVIKEKVPGREAAKKYGLL